MSQSTNVENKSNNSGLAMVVGLDFVNGKEFKKSIEMHQGNDGEIPTKSNKETKVEMSKEALKYFIDRWTEKIKLSEIRGEKEEIARYKASIKTAEKILNAILEKDNEEMSK